MPAGKKKALGRGMTEAIHGSGSSSMEPPVTSSTAPGSADEPERVPSQTPISMPNSPQPTDLRAGSHTPEFASMSSGKGDGSDESDGKDSAPHAASLGEGITLDEAAFLGQGEKIESVESVGNDPSHEAAAAEEEHRLSAASAGLDADATPPRAPTPASVPVSPGQDLRASDERSSARTFWAFG